MRDFRPFILLLLAVACGAPVADEFARAGHADAASGSHRRAWEHESSDIAPDPAIRFGHFDNGLRWAWAANPEPDQRSYLRLHVDAGSFGEDESELGMAHFLEHMAFNGSEHFEPGTLVEWFQEHGMAFGADLNAYTSFRETVYTLDLPNSDGQTLREGLEVLSDFAFGMRLDPEEVEAEKGVIDGEQRERDSAGFRVFEQTLDRLYDGTRYATRMPIGKAETRAAFTAGSVRDFYRRWYRPENMTLVLVGDLEDLDPEPLFAEFFAGVAPPDRPWQPEPSKGEPTMDATVFVVRETELPDVSITVERLRPWVDRPYDSAWVRSRIPLGFAHAMLNLRYRELTKKAETPFLSARVDRAGGLEVFEGASLGVSCEGEKWRQALQAAEAELRRALQYGFRQAELDEVRADSLRRLDEAVERQATRPSGGLVREILAAAESRVVPTDAGTDRALRRDAILALDVEACHAALVDDWGKGELSLYATGDLPADVDGDDLLDAWEDSRRVEVAPPAEIAVDAFAYASDPAAAGEVVSREHVEDLDLWLVRFANGVRLNVKTTDFKEREILVRARVSEGLLTLPPEESATAFVGDAVFNGGGLQAHSEDDLRRLTAGRQVGVGFDVGQDAFTLGGGTTEEDLQLQLDLLAAYLAHPGWRDEGLVQLRQQVPLIFEQMKHQPFGPLVLEFLPELHNGDLRFTQLPPRDAIDAVGVDEVAAWLGPELATGALEVTVVGDVGVDAVVAAVASSLGALPPRAERRPWTERRAVPPPRSGLRMTREVETVIPSSLVFVVFPTDDGMQAERRRHLNFLGTVVDDRLRLEVRERLGAAYSPNAGSNASEVFPGVGTLGIQAMAEPAGVDALVEACLAVAGDLASRGVTDEEVARLREPVLKQLRDARRNNSFWLQVTEDVQSDPGKLDDLRALDAFYADLSAGPLSELAARYLDPARASVLVVNPVPASGSK